MALKMKISTTKQFETLVVELEKIRPWQKDFGEEQFRPILNTNGKKLGKKLNSFGPPLRDSDGWQKVWRDLKFKVKKKIVANKAECNATGGGRYKQATLSPLEEAVANILQFEKQINPEGAVQGVRIIVQDDEIAVLEDVMEQVAEEFEMHIYVGDGNDFNMELNMEEPVTEEASAKKRKLQQKSEATKAKPARKGTDGHFQYSRYQRKLLEVEEKKFKLMESKHKSEKKLYESEMKIKSLKIQIKEKELQLLNK